MGWSTDRLVSVFLQLFKTDHFQCCVFGGLEANQWSHAIVVGLFPTGSTNTPSISRLEPRELEGRNRG